MRHILTLIVALTALLCVRSSQSKASGATGVPLVTDFSLVFVESNGVYAVSSQGRVIEKRSEFKTSLSMINFPIMSPNGVYIAYLHLDTSGPSNRRYLRIAGRSGETLRSLSTVNAYPLEWSWNSQSVVLWSIDTRQLQLLNVDSGQVELIAGTEGSCDASLSPDLNKVVYSLGGSLKIFDSHTLDRAVLTTGNMPAWSPNGKWIAFVDNDKYFLISPSGEGRKLLGPASQRHTSAHWSPNSKLISYTRMLEPSDKIPRLPEYDDNYVVIVTSLVDFHSDWVYRHAGFFPRDFYWVTLPRRP